MGETIPAGRFAPAARYPGDMGAHGVDVGRCEALAAAGLAYGVAAALPVPGRLPGEPAEVAAIGVPRRDPSRPCQLAAARRVRAEARGRP